MNDEKFLKLFIMCFYIILKIFCLAPYSIDFKTFKVHNSSFSVFLNILIVTMCLLLDEPLERKIYEEHDTYFLSKLVKIFNSLLTLKSYILVAASVLLIIVKNQQRKKAFEDLVKVVSYFKWASFKLILRQNIKNFIKVQLIFVSYFVIARYFYYIAPNKNPRWLIGLIYVPLSQYRYLIVIVLVGQKHLISVFLDSCFKALNNFLKAQIIRSNNSSELSVWVDQTARIHFRLVEIAIYLIVVMIILDTLVNFVVEGFIVYLSSMLYVRGNFKDHVLQSFIMEIILVGLYGVVRIGQIIVIVFAGYKTAREVILFLFLHSHVRMYFMSTEEQASLQSKILRPPTPFHCGWLNLKQIYAFICDKLNFVAA